MAYKQDAGRDDLTNPNISALTNGGGDPPTKSLRSTVYDANRFIQEVKDNPVPLSEPAERLANPELSSFRFRGTEAYKDQVQPKNEGLKDIYNNNPGSFYKSKNDRQYPYLSSRFNTNPQIKDPIRRNTTQEMRQKVSFSDNLDDRTYADIDKTEGDKRARGSFNVHPKVMKEAETAAKTSFKLSKDLAEAQVTGSESTMLAAINNAVSTTRNDTYMKNHAPQVKNQKTGVWEKSDPVSYENASMIQGYITKHKIGSGRQDDVDTFRNVGQDLQKARTNNKFSLNSNNSSNSKTTANNLFKNSALTTDVTDGKKKRFNF
tara:strand:+ start:367 stop:1323 length:957 start_codon:yes stop_codon:yes gene_type:complete